MLDFLFQKPVVNSTQKFIDKLQPKVNVHVPDDLPMPSCRYLKKKCVIVAQVNALEDRISKLSDVELKNKTQEYRSQFPTAVKIEKDQWEELKKEYKNAVGHEEKEQLNIRLEEAQKAYVEAKQKYLNSILPEAFAVVRETGKRVLSMRHFDVQLVGGIVLHEGNIAEMTTGEGKTLVATLPAYLNALTGEGVHIVTVNDYLARRDREWMGPVFEFLGLSVGVIQHDMDHQQRQGQYNCDITYGTNNEFGFDYLRDNMVNEKREMVQRPHHFAIVDEVDSILIDEARTPLIISGPAEESTDKYYRAYEISKQLKGRRITEKDEIDAKYKEIDLTKGYDYMADEKAKSISLTEDGETKSAKMFGIDNLHDMETIEYRHHILQALKAKEFFKKDVDYVVRDNQVIIVDEFTGRLMPGRRWSDGLHQSVEAKEGMKIERENQTLATITFQNYFRLYEKLSGMTGTAYTEAAEFEHIYKLECVVIPTNKKVQRKNYPDSIYKNTKGKFKAVVDEIEQCHKKGQPVLVGTISIEKSEILSHMLKQKGIQHQVLNAKYHEREAHIISQAGRYKGVTIATNMAGRGTDIVLGGNAEFLAKNLAAEQMKDQENDQAKEEMIKTFIEQFKQQTKEEHDKVVEQGGLHVIGTERHESRRIDNQLRGRQGRQGDPGSSRFYVSLEDDLMRLFASDRIIGLMDRMGMEEDQVLDQPILSGALENAQKRVETHNFEIRKQLLEFDNVMNKQREVIYGRRREILEAENVNDQILEAIEDVVYDLTEQYLTSQGEGAAWDIDGLDVYLKSKFDYSLGELKNKIPEISREEVRDAVIDGLKKHYAAKESSMDGGHLRFVERMVLMHIIDTKWKDHLYAMDQLKEGINLRALGQRDPLIEYKKEGFYMFQEMYATISHEVAELMFKIQPPQSAEQQAHRMRGVFSSLPQQAIHQEASGYSDAAQRAAADTQAAPHAHAPSQTPIKNDAPKVGRNDPCPCGSGKKYKKCCGQ